MRANQSLLFSTLLLLFVCGCAQNRQTTAPATRAPDLTHTVHYQGETLASIAKWYTGAASNWTAIRDANPALDPRKMRIGTTLVIPRDLARRSDPPPAPKAPTMAKKEPAPPAVEATDNPTDTQDTYAAQIPSAPPVSAENAPLSPEQLEASVPTTDEPAVALDDSTGSSTNDRASADIGNEPAPTAQDDILNADGPMPPTDGDPAAFPSSPPPPTGGLVKGILEAVGNAALDSKQPAAPSQP